MAFQVDQKVLYKPGNRVGFIVKDLGIVRPTKSPAPMAQSASAEQCWAVMFYHDAHLPATELGESVGRCGYADVHGCAESDLEPA